MTEIRHCFLAYRALSRSLAVLCALLACHAPAQAGTTVFTYYAGESRTDVRHNYKTEALKLALDKTRDKYGAYQLTPSPIMSSRRVLSAASNNELPNLMLVRSYQSDAARQNLIFSKFPVDLGILGYRVCFVSPQAKEKLREVSTLDELKNFSIGQGSGWADVDILRRNGFTVIEVSSYESLFRMIGANRFDLLCRGANEFYEEYREHPNLPYDESIALAYLKPSFFHTHKSNRKGLERVEEGLKLAYRDGSLQKLWRKYYTKSLKFAKLSQRKIFWLDNPFLPDLDFNYRQYIYDPLAASEKTPPRR